MELANYTWLCMWFGHWASDWEKGYILDTYCQLLFVVSEHHLYLLLVWPRNEDETVWQYCACTRLAGAARASGDRRENEALQPLHSTRQWKVSILCMRTNAHKLEIYKHVPGQYLSIGKIPVC